MMELRCVCLDLKFMDLLRYARQNDISCVNELSEQTQCSTKCGSCRPLLAELLRDNQVTLCGKVIPYPHFEHHPKKQPASSE